MQPIFTSEEIRDLESEMLDEITEAELIRRAGWATSRQAIAMLGGAYAKRILVIAGPGNNGQDGVVAGEFLEARGAKVEIVEPKVVSGSTLPVGADLVIDAAFGIGLTREYDAPRIANSDNVKVLAVDIPSGVMADTGELNSSALTANVTVTFFALKPGLMLGDGLIKSGRVILQEIGIEKNTLRFDKSHKSHTFGTFGTTRMAPERSKYLVQRDSPTLHIADLYELSDIVAMLPNRARHDHKWSHAVGVIAGSPGYIGAGELCVKAAMASGAGMATWIVPGADDLSIPTGEWISYKVASGGWEDRAIELVQRCKSVVIGPGLGRSESTASAIKRFVSSVDLPLVIDADALFALGNYESAKQILSKRIAPTILTPHSGEMQRLLMRDPDLDRLNDVNSVSQYLNATVLLKGATTIVGSPSHRLRCVRSIDARLATAGTGDVLAGVIGALLAYDLSATDAATLASAVCNFSSERLASFGCVASDLVRAIPEGLDYLAGDRSGHPRLSR